MPIIKSAIKRVRQTAVRTARNNITKRSLKQARRALDAGLATKGSKNLSELLSTVQAQLDTAVKKNLLHKNQAARLKARYAKAVKAAGAKPVKKAAKASKPAAKKAAAKRPAKKAPAKKK